MIKGVLLDYTGDYWRRFILTDGSLDEDALLAAGYDGDGQVDWLKEEMEKRGWLVKGEANEEAEDNPIPPSSDSNATLSDDNTFIKAPKVKRSKKAKE